MKEYRYKEPKLRDSSDQQWPNTTLNLEDGFINLGFSLYQTLLWVMPICTFMIRRKAQFCYYLLQPTFGQTKGTCQHILSLDHSGFFLTLD